MPHAIREMLRRHRWTLAIGVPFIAASYWLPVPRLPLPPDHVMRAAGLGVVSITFAVAWARWRCQPMPWNRWPGAVLAAGGVSLFLDAFMRWKAWLPLVHPFTWDAPLTQLSVALHLGKPLSVWLLPVLGAPPVLRFLDWCYYLWFPIMAAVVLWQAWSADRERARRFALAFVLVWSVLGVALAGVFLSMGPIFLTHPGPFAPLLAAVAAAHPSGTEAMRAELWHYWTTRGVSSIAAMPSVHVALPVLYACAARGRLRWLFVGYALLIFLGSVMLGWHYAIDGYTSALAVPALWRLAGRFTHQSDHVRV